MDTHDPPELDPETAALVRACKPGKRRIRTPLDNAVCWLRRSMDRVAALRAQEAADVLVDDELISTRSAMELVASEREGRGPVFHALDTEYRLSVVLPPAADHGDGAPIDVTFVSDGLLMRHANGLVHFLFATGESLVCAVQVGDIVCTIGTHVLFKCGPHNQYTIYDVASRGFCDDGLERFPAVHVNSLVSRSMSLIDLHRGSEAAIPGFPLDDHAGYVMSADARWLWGRIHPGVDGFGVLDVERGAPVFDPWPGRGGRDPIHWWDDTVRAVSRRPDGEFQLFYGGRLMRGTSVVATVAPDAIGAAFDAHGDHLAVFDAEELRMFALDSVTAAPTLVGVLPLS